MRQGTITALHSAVVACSGVLTSVSTCACAHSLYMGLVLHRAAPAWEYSIRMNYTLVPSTSGSQLDSFARSANFG